MPETRLSVSVSLCLIGRLPAATSCQEVAGAFPFPAVSNVAANASVFAKRSLVTVFAKRSLVKPKLAVLLPAIGSLGSVDEILSANVLALEAGSADESRAGRVLPTEAYLFAVPVAEYCDANFETD